MEVVIYKVKGKNGYMYDYSFNPNIDFSVLKSTRDIQLLEVVTPKISLELAQRLISEMRRFSTMFYRVFIPSDIVFNTLLKRYNIKKVSIIIGKPDNSLPSLQIVESVEKNIIGKIISYRKIINIAARLNINEECLKNTLQALYCMRRIKVMPSRATEKSNVICTVCKNVPCQSCSIGFKQDDILFYAADSYSIEYHNNISLNKVKPDDNISSNNIKDEIKVFMNSKRENCVLKCAPKAFSYSFLEEIIVDTVKNGGRVIYITSSYLCYEVKEYFNNLINGISIGISDDINYKKYDFCISSYSSYSCFYKAYDLVIYDMRYSFIDRPSGDMFFACKRAMKEKGKILSIVHYSGNNKSGVYENNPYYIMIPTQNKKPIPEPRIITSRYIKSEDVVMPQIALDLLMWSVKCKKGVIVFVPDEASLEKVYTYIANLQGIDNEYVDTSSNDEKSYLFKLLKKETKILISMEFKDVNYNIDNINVIVMYSDNEIFKEDTLVNISAIAMNHDKDVLGEVVFVANQETETMSLAKSAIRELNKVTWENGFIKQ